jgi:regulator of protease activity HflC (stomatin/prohibitin superfamily)
MVSFPWSRRNSPATPQRRSALWRFLRPRLGRAVLYSLIATFAAIVLWPYMVVTVPSGQVGVLWKRFGGTVLDPSALRNEGLHVILPWDRIFLYNLRIQSVTETYQAISSDGIGLTATLNIRFRLRREIIPQLHQSIGPGYVTLLGPEVASRLREVVARYTAEQAYSSDRQKIQEEIKNRVIQSLGERFMERDGAVSYHVPIRDAGVLYDTLLQEISLPPDIIAAINRKAEQYYISQEYVYRIDRERRESERKKIEAAGISAFQQIVSQGFSDSYLRWRGIEATLELSKSKMQRW